MEVWTKQKSKNGFDQKDQILLMLKSSTWWEKWISMKESVHQSCFWVESNQLIRFTNSVRNSILENRIWNVIQKWIFVNSHRWKIIQNWNSRQLSGISSIDSNRLGQGIVGSRWIVISSALNMHKEKLRRPQQITN